MKVAVTGASGLLGSAVMRELQRRGHRALALGRPMFTLGLPPASLDGVDGLVHCAYDFDALGWAQVKRSNVDGSLALLEAARQAEVSRLVFVSSISAWVGCRSDYGRGKLAVEQAFAAAGGTNVRPGLIHAEVQSRGMLASLRRVAGMPLLPVFGNGRQPFYLVHVDDVAHLIVDALDLPEIWRQRTVVAANPVPYAFIDLLRLLARAQGHPEPRFVHIPFGLGLTLLGALEYCGIRPPFRSDSLLGMRYPDPAPPLLSGEKDGQRFRPFLPEPARR